MNCIAEHCHSYECRDTHSKLLDNSLPFDQPFIYALNKRESLTMHYHTDKQSAWPSLLQENVKS